jgi:hypothetical protein
MNETELNNLLGKIGKGIFVKYFREFRECSDAKISNQDMIALLQNEERFTPASCAARTANARRIFHEDLEGPALRMIAESRRVDQNVADEACALLEKLRLRRRPVSSALPRTQKNMEIIKIIKLAIQKAAKERKKMSTFHSQVLLHAKLVEHLDPAEFCRDVGVPAAYHIEFRKMIAVAHALSELGYSIQRR